MKIATENLDSAIENDDLDDLEFHIRDTEIYQSMWNNALISAIKNESYQIVDKILEKDLVYPEIRQIMCKQAVEDDNHDLMTCFEEEYNDYEG